MIQAIFFCRFHPEKGPIILHQVPDGSVVPSGSSTTSKSLFDFGSISDYLIPQQEFCDQLVSIWANHYRIIGHPVCLVNPQKYERNEFIFNLALVLREDANLSSYQVVVRKLARLLRDLEEQSSLLSRDELNPLNEMAGLSRDRNGGIVYAICEMIFEDLNNYNECMIPINESDTINLKLFPTYPFPPSVKSWHVPLSTVHLSSLIDDNWDLTMSRIVPFIDGVNSVAMIAQLADVDLQLTRKALSHLLYYGCLLLLDIFQFSATYAPTADIHAIFSDSELQEECALYVTTGNQKVKVDTVLKLFSSLKQGASLRTWCLENMEILAGIDVRRFITFGVIKGLLYRVHKYPVAKQSRIKRFETELSIRRKSNAHQEHVGGDTGKADESFIQANGRRELSLERYLDGMHCFDQICTELQMSEKELISRLRQSGDVHVIHK